VVENNFKKAKKENIYILKNQSTNKQTNVHE
jgi:hypothetical protein